MDFVYRCPVHGDFVVKKPNGQGTDFEICPQCWWRQNNFYERGRLRPRVYFSVPFTMKAE